MKKNKIAFLILLILCFPLCFFACTDKQIQLSKPYSVGYVINESDEEPQILLVTDKNPNATKYEFFISDSLGEDKTYLSYLSSDNFLDVTDIFTDQKSYSFYVRYLGTGKYTPSKPSDTKSYNANITPVTTPSLQINETTLNWFKISYASNYEIYETIKNADDSIKTEETKIATVNSSTFSYDISSRLSNESPYYKYSYTIKALGTGFYSNSQNSNQVDYIKHIKLDTPQNVNCNKSNDKVILTFNEVEYATKYKVTVNDDNSKTFETAETTYDVTSYITNYASFYFKVQAIESEAIDYEMSENSNIIEYKNQLKLSVSNLSCSRDGESIVISFTGHELASNKYTLSISYNGSEIYNDSLFTLDNNGTRKILISDNLELVSGLIKISVKANAVSEYILESDFAEIEYNII